MLFAAGAALSALGGDTVGSLVDSSASPAACGAPASTDSTTAEDGVQAPSCDGVPTDEGTATSDAPTGTEPPATTVETETAPAPPSTGDEGTATGETPTATTTTGAGAGDPGSLPAGGQGQGPSPSPGTAAPEPAGGEPIAEPVRPPSETPPAVDPETGYAASALVWLHRTVPDPVPQAKRLAPGFARALVRASRRHHVAWPFVLGVLRADGDTGPRPATRATLDRTAKTLAAAGLAQTGLGPKTRAWRALLALRGRTTFADRVLALARYDRAVGLRSLVAGLESERDWLARRVLRDRKIELYPAGRADVEAGRVNVRVLVLLRYLRIGFGEVAVSSLVSGHRLYARPGVVSAHVYGLAVDVSRLGGVPILGHQQPKSVTERAVADILLLPQELRPQQVISLLGLGGPSFPLADHYDHIHVGY